MDKSEKIKKSQEQRLQSLKAQADEYKLKKNLIRDQLSNNTINQNKSKKFFSDSENEEEEEDRKEKKSKSFNLFENDEKKAKKKHNSTDDSEENSSDGSENLFEKKLNLDENKANKLIYLKTKFSNDDRFKIDERFIDSDDSGKEEDDSNNEVKQENENALRILEQITGKPIKKLHESKEAAKASELESKKKSSKMIRYDPSKEEHKVFEINKDDEQVSIKSSKRQEKSQEDEPDAPAAPTTDASHYYEIRDDIKNLFCKNEVFKFKFTNQQEKESDEEEEDSEEDEKNVKNFNQMKRSLDYLSIKNNKYESSISSEGEDDHNQVIHDRESRKTTTATATPYQPINFINEKNADFFPNLDDSRLQEALVFFKRPKELDELRQEWTKEREELVEDYKKKHSRAKRIQRVKNDEKLFVWKKTSFEQKKYKKHKK